MNDHTSDENVLPNVVDDSSLQVASDHANEDASRGNQLKADNKVEEESLKTLSSDAPPA